MNYLLDENLRNDLKVVIAKATHSSFSWEQVNTILIALDRLPEGQSKVKAEPDPGMQCEQKPVKAKKK